MLKVMVECIGILYANTICKFTNFCLEMVSNTQKKPKKLFGVDNPVADKG